MDFYNLRKNSPNICTYIFIVQMDETNNFTSLHHLNVVFLNTYLRFHLLKSYLNQQANQCFKTPSKLYTIYFTYS